MKDPFSQERRLLDAKLNASAGGVSPVVRKGIEAALSRQRSLRVVVVCAPAGFGKTTVMLQHRDRAAREGVATGWLTLDRSDNDATRLLRGLAAASEQIVEEPEDDGAVTPLLDALAAARRPFILFLDDFESLSEPAALALVRDLIDRLPAGGQVVIGCRAQPDLRLARLRAREQLLEIDASLLRFDLGEATEFLAARHNPPLTADEIESLHRRTDGWAAALLLASAALERDPDRGAFIDRFSGTDRTTAEYLAEEVLGRQEPGMRDFLLRTSMVQDLEPSLCEALVPGVDGKRMLERIETSALPLVRTGLERPTYRIHSLFRQFLHAQIERDDPQSVAEIHRAAARWYETQGRPVPAIEHFVAAGDVERALALLERHGGQLLSQGRMRLLWRWFERLPADLAGRPALLAIKVWAACGVRGAEEARALLGGSGLENVPDPQVRASARAVVPLILAMEDRYEEAWRTGRESLRHIPSGNAFADTVLANTMSTVFAAMGDNAGAKRLLDVARRNQTLEPSAFNVTFTETAAGFIDLQEGRMRQAASRFRTAATISGDAYSPAHGNAWTGIPYAASLYEANDIDEARRLLEIYLPLARDVGLLDPVATGHVLLSRIAFNRGDIDEAYRTLSDLEYLGYQRRLRRMVACAQLERARLHIVKGHYPAARTELEFAEDRSIWSRAEKLRLPANDVEYVGLGWLRLELHDGDPDVAGRKLESERVAAEQAGRHRRAFKLLLLRCIALYRSRKTADWRPLAAEVLRQAHEERFIRLVLDEGPVAVAMIRDYLGTPDEIGSSPMAAYAAELLAAAGPVAASATDELYDRPADALTRKEAAVLKLVAEGHSNEAIAAKLFVSESTVRTHLRNLFVKLDASSRTQAVARARKLHLVA
jgi:LuxR family maltose regulon positive regulatory protein